MGTENSKVKTPMLDKMLEIQGESQICGEFLGYKCYHFCEISENTNRKMQCVKRNRPKFFAHNLLSYLYFSHLVIC